MTKMSNKYIQSNIQTIQWPKCQTIVHKAIYRQYNGQNVKQLSTKQYTDNTMAKMSNDYLQSNIQTIQWPKCQTIIYIAIYRQYNGQNVKQLST